MILRWPVSYFCRAEPSTRDIRLRTGGEVSHTTIARALRDGEALPRWGNLSPIIEALGGDREWFRRRWVAMKDDHEPLLELAVGPSTSGHSVDGEHSLPRLNSLGDADHAQDNLNEKNKKQEEEQESVRDQLAKAREDLAELNAKIATMKREKDVDMKTITFLHEERERLMQNIDQLRQRLRIIREEKINLQQQQIHIATRRSELNYDWARWEELEINRLSKEVAELRRRLDP